MGLFAAWAKVTFKRLRKNCQSNVSSAKKTLEQAPSRLSDTKRASAEAALVKWQNVLDNLVEETELSKMPDIRFVQFGLAAFVLIVEAEILPGAPGMSAALKPGNTANGPSDLGSTVAPGRSPLSMDLETEAIAKLAHEQAEQRKRARRNDPIGTGRTGQRQRVLQREGFAFSSDGPGGDGDTGIRESFGVTASSLQSLARIAAGPAASAGSAFNDDIKQFDVGPTNIALYSTSDTNLLHCTATLALRVTNWPTL
jgi:hypothetical protein